MGLLGDIYSFGNRAKRAAKGLLSDPIGTVQQSVGELTDNIKEYNRLNKIAWESKDPVAQRQAEDQVNKMSLNGLLNFAPIGMTVWHGSPHKFSKFDMSKIGTGEGAQAYGHGLYLAENPAVATEYRNKLSTGYTGGDGSLTHYGDAYQTAYDAAQSAGATRPDHARAIASQVQEWVDSGKKASTFMRYNSVPKELEPAYKAATDAWKAFKPNEGALYKVDIPDEAVARFLDWDKPLSQQAPEIRDAVRRLSIPEQEARFAPDTWKLQWDDRISGYGASPQIGGIIPLNTSDKTVAAEAMKKLADDWYQASGVDVVDQLVSKLGGPEKAANALKEQGIPGIRYLDGGSRSAGQGSSNFVLFSDDLPRILETNGVPTGLQPWQPGEWQGLLR